MLAKLKILGLALAAVVAVSAIASASASAAEFHAEVSPATLKGEQIGAGDVFNTDSGEIECSSASYSGSQTGTTASTVEVEPSYSECSALFGATVTSDVEGCKYRFYANGGQIDIVCPAGKVMKFTATGCIITIPPQTVNGTITYTTGTRNGKHDLTMHVSLSGIRYIEHQGSFFHTCAHSATAETSNGTLIATITMWAEWNGIPIHLTVA